MDKDESYSNIPLEMAREDSLNLVDRFAGQLGEMYFTNDHDQDDQMESDVLAVPPRPDNHQSQPSVPQIQEINSDGEKSTFTPINKLYRQYNLLTEDYSYREFIKIFPSTEWLHQSETLSTLRDNWSALGVERISKWFNYTYRHNHGKEAKSEAYLEGMIDSLKISAMTNQNKTMEEMALVSAELKLVSDRVDKFNQSRKIMETQWRSQTDTVSGYMTKLESLLKTHVDILTKPHQEPKPIPTKAVTEETKSSQLINHGGYYYKVIDKKIQECGYHPAKKTKTSEKIVTSINNLLAYDDRLRCLHQLDPETILKVLKEVSARNPGQDFSFWANLLYQTLKKEKDPK
ncbi:hypothetical protein [Agrotis ipsilon virus]|nr:hypothetical protein [Agrotis ipsilon virus]